MFTFQVLYFWGTRVALSIRCLYPSSRLSVTEAEQMIIWCDIRREYWNALIGRYSSDFDDGKMNEKSQKISQLGYNKKLLHIIQNMDSLV